MRIAFVTPKMIIGGAETYIITKSQWLIAHGHSVIVISAGGENVQNLPQEVIHITFPTEISPASFSKKEYTSYLSKLSAILLDHQIDLIEAHNTSPVIHIAQSYRITRIPYLINVLNERSYLNNPFLRKLTPHLASLGLFFTLTPEMHAYIERQTKSTFPATILPIPVAAIPNGHQTGNEHYILSVCRMAPDKMYVKYLIKDFGKLLKSGQLDPSYKLHIVGDGELFSEVDQCAQRINQSQAGKPIVMCGALTREPLWDKYRNCSLYIGTGTSLLLAASCGKPILIPGFSKQSMPFAWGVWGERETDNEILAVGNQSGHSRANYAQLIATLLSDSQRAAAAGEKARQLFSQHYTIDKIMQSWEQEYQRIINTFANDALEKQIRHHSDIYNTIRTYRPLWYLRGLIKPR